jgi:hypothetical protein
VYALYFFLSHSSAFVGLSYIMQIICYFLFFNYCFVGFLPVNFVFNIKLIMGFDI